MPPLDSELSGGGCSAGATSKKDVAIDFDSGLEPTFRSIAVTDAQVKSLMNRHEVIDPSNKAQRSHAG